MSVVIWIYDAETRSMRAARKFHSLCDNEFCDQERYVMEPVDEVQSARDKAYHANIRDLWMNLREGDDERFPNPTDFRWWLLTECGFCDVAKLAFASSKAARAALPFLQRPGVQISVVGSVVVVKSPWSQKLRGGMSKDDRLRSYKETIDLAESMIGVSPGDTERSEAA